jgi:hypothetical protein
MIAMNRGGRLEKEFQEPEKEGGTRIQHAGVRTLKKWQYRK